MALVAREPFDELPIYIYALRDPRTGAFVYVGQTTNPDARLAQIMSAPHSIGLRAWLVGLLEQGGAPELQVLEQCGEFDACDREFEWITRLRQEGCSLLNVFGVSGRKIRCNVPRRRPGPLVSVSFFAEEKDVDALQRLADRRKLTPSAVIRSLIREAAKREGIEVQEQ